MIKLIQYLSTKQSFLVFVFLELIALILIIKTNDYAQLKTRDFQTAIAGSINQKINLVNRHFYLQKYNDSLLKQNAYLLEQLQNKHQNTHAVPTTLPQQYRYIPAYVISNQYDLQHNNLLINKGEADGIRPDNGVITTNGITGVVQKTSSHYAKVISILNKSLKINVALKNTNYSGFLQWPGKDPNRFEVVDLPVNAPIKKGDTIITGGMSGIFPKGIPVGQIYGYQTVPGRKSYVIYIKSFSDMTDLGPVYVIKNRMKTEIDSLKM